MTETDPFVGRTLAGRYEVLKKLNQGGVGAVYLAMQRPLDRPVALKVLLRKHADDPTAIKRFEKEAASIARLAHAHIVTVYDFGTTDEGDLFIAMEFLRGQSLRDLLDAAGWIPWERSLHVVQGVTRALVAAHTQKIVHRDLKPENIMLVESNGDLDFAKVLDFGLARSIQGQGAPQITRHDVIPGTPVYMSPERANGISDDPRSDLYALGAVWFELLCGEPPFTGETSIKVILRHVHETPRKPSLAQPQNAIPPFIDDLILALLEKQPDKRPSSARALLEQLEALARPAGWHVSRPDEVARRGAHDQELATYAVAAAAVADTLHDDSFEMRFAVAEPLPLTKKKAPPPSMTQEQPLLLTQKKPAPQPVTSPPAMSSSSSSSPPAMSSSSSSSSSVPPTSAPSMPLPVLLAPPPGSVVDVPRTDSAARLPTEDFLRVPDTMPEIAPAALRPPADVDDARAPVRPVAIASIAEVAGWLGTARTTRAVGELCAAFLVSRFDRAAVLDLRAEGPVVLGVAGFSTAAQLVHGVRGATDLCAYAARREAYYGPSIAGPDWMHWYGALGGIVPGAMFIAGLQSEGRLAFLFYADHKDVTLRPAVKDTVVLLREAAGALSLVG